MLKDVIVNHRDFDTVKNFKFWHLIHLHRLNAQC